jgi:Leucine-rich repeat (LRR) protein
VKVGEQKTRNVASPSSFPHFSLSFRIGQLSKLQYCDLSSNMLSSLPEAAVNLSELQFLDLSSNKFKRLQPFLGNMEKLQRLMATNNPLTNIPREILEVLFLLCLLSVFISRPLSLLSFRSCVSLSL